MVGFRHVATLAGPAGGFGTNVTDLTLGVVGDRLMLYSATHRGGGIAAWRVAGDGTAAQPVAAYAYPAALGHNTDPQVVLLDRPDGLSLLAAGLSRAGDAVRRLDADGLRGAADAPMTAAPLPADLSTAGTFRTAEGQAMMYVARQGTAGFSLWRQLPDGRVVAAGASVPPPGLVAGAQTDSLCPVRIGSVDLIVSASVRGNFLAAHRVLPDGTLAPGEYLGTRDGAGFNGPRAIVAAEVEGHHFIVAGSAFSSSLTTLRVLPGGRLVPVDHVLDERTTRFQNVTVLEAVHVDGRAYVVAGGADDGLSLFTLSPDGRLIHLRTIEDQRGLSLADVSALAVRAWEGRLVVFAASATESGLTQFEIDPGAIGQTRHVGEGGYTGTDAGDLIQGGLNTTLISGGGGDDILIAGSRSIALTGGKGADVFVPLAVSGRVAVRDYEHGVDRLDLSMLGMIRSTAQLRFLPTASGIRIRFGDTVIDLRSRDGWPLSAQMFDDSLFPVAHYKPPDVRSAVTGTAAANLLQAARGGSTVWGLGGSDTLLGSGLEDHLVGGIGHDRILSFDGDDTVWGDGGNDQIRTGAGNDHVVGSIGHDVILTEDGNDRVSAQHDNDIVYAGAGNDRIGGGKGFDYLAGDDGDDFLFGQGDDDRMVGGGGSDVMIDLEGDNVFRDSSGSNMMFGGIGRDRMYGGIHADTLRPGGGDDFAAGGQGRDVIFSADGNDVCLGEDGDDLVLGGNGDDWLYGGIGADFVDGGPGADRVVGHDGGDALIGGDGDDVVLGGNGADTLRGGVGNDRLFSGEHDDRILGGIGDDTAMGDGGADLILGGGGQDLLGGGEGADTLDGNWDADALFGNGGDDLIIGGTGADTLRGGMGADDLAGGHEDDALNGGAGNDRLTGDAGDDLLIGLWDDDVLRGGDGADRLYGGEGDDVLVGGAGADLLWGEGGADVFVFADRDATPGGPDRIAGFAAGEDRIDLSALDLTWIGTAAFSGRAGQLRWFAGDGGVEIRADLDGDARADLALFLDGLAGVGASDFIL